MSTPNPFGHNPFDSTPAAQSPVGGPPPQPARHGEANTLATLSVIFAFVFAPAGAILGHLSLSQIARTGQRGRDRALVGTTVSYVVITAAVVALVVWAALGHNDTGAPPAAAPSPSKVSAAPTTTTTTPPPPPPPTVAPADIDRLLPTVDDERSLTNNPRLAFYNEMRQMVRPPEDAPIDRIECSAAMGEGEPESYDLTAVVAYHDQQFRDTVNKRDPSQVLNGVVAFRDAAAAQTQLQSLITQWRRCANSVVVATFPDQRSSTAFGAPVDAGNGITTLIGVVTPDGLTSVRVIAAKANIIVDVLLCALSRHDEMPAALAITNFILDKIPGPR